MTGDVTDDVRRGLGACVTPQGVHFSVTARDAAQVTLCLFEGARETRLAMTRENDRHHLFVPKIQPGQAYGYRAEGPWAPEKALLFDSSKLLADPYALALDRPFAFDPRLSEHGFDTAGLVLQVYRATLGGTHPFTLVAENNMSTYLRGVGSHREALAMVDETLGVLQAFFKERRAAG